MKEAGLSQAFLVQVHLPAYKPVLGFQRDGQKTLGQFRRLSQRDVTIDSHQAILGEYRLELKDIADADHRFLAFRPEDVQLHRTGSFDGQTNALAGTVCRIAHQGVLGEVTVRTPSMRYRAVLTAAEIFKKQLSIGDNVVGTIAPEALHTL